MVDIIGVRLCIVIIILLVVFICFATYKNRKKQNELISRIHKMIEEASAGTFREEVYEETRISELETAMWHYLSSSNLSKKQMEEQKEKIQTLISDISHQTVAPIANIKIYTELIEEQIKDREVLEISGDDMMLEVSAIKMQVEKLDFLIQSLVKISRLENGVIMLDPKENQISEVLEAVHAQYAMKAKAKNVEFIVGDSREKAFFDSKWTIEALGNIVDNAIKYTNQGGKIIVRVETYQLFLRVDVVDNGLGIEEKEIAKIFRRFYRSRNVAKEKGVGIGLFLANEILKREKGYMKAVSKIGEGSTFSIFLYHRL